MRITDDIRRIILWTGGGGIEAVEATDGDWLSIREMGG